MVSEVGSHQPPQWFSWVTKKALLGACPGKAIFVELMKLSDYIIVSPFEPCQLFFRGVAKKWPYP